MRTKSIGEHCVNKFPYGSLNMSAATITPQRNFYEEELYGGMFLEISI
jgi:hypothetical protein